ncbi:MAG: hypothetical protein U9R19_08630 [Bacteroidota bacterium]|nr:hypothetical protein [Bacteroidota bacterium]
MKRFLPSLKATILILFAVGILSIGNSAIAQIQITAATGPGSICIGDSIELFVNVTGGSGPITYAWSSSPSGWADTLQSTYASPTINTNYTVEISDTINSIDTTFLITVNPLPIVDLSSFNIFCEGSSIDIEIDNFAAILWSNGSTDTIINVNTNSTVWVEVTDVNGCIGSDTVVIAEQPLPVVDLGADTAFCDGLTITFDAGNGLNYLWNNGTTAQTLEVGTDGNFSVEVTDSYGCMASDDVEVTIYPLPVMTLTGDTVWMCVDDTIEVIGGTDMTYTYEWSNSLTDAIINVDAIGNYTLIITTDMECVDSIEIIVDHQRDAISSFVFFETFNHVVFENHSQNAWVYVWDFGDGSDLSLEENPVHDYPADTSNVFYIVTLYAANQCMEDTSTADVLTFDIEEFGGTSDISLFPNPNNGIFSLNGKLPANEEFSLRIKHA